MPGSLEAPTGDLPRAREPDPGEAATPSRVLRQDGGANRPQDKAPGKSTAGTAPESNPGARGRSSSTCRCPCPGLFSMRARGSTGCVSGPIETFSWRWGRRTGKRCAVRRAAIRGAGGCWRGGSTSSRVTLGGRKVARPRLRGRRPRARRTSWGFGGRRPPTRWTRARWRRSRPACRRVGTVRRRTRIATLAKNMPFRAAPSRAGSWRCRAGACTNSRRAGVRTCAGSRPEAPPIGMRRACGPHALSCARSSRPHTTRSTGTRRALPSRGARATSRPGLLPATASDRTPPRARAAGRSRTS